MSLTAITLIAESKDAALADVEKTFADSDFIVRKDIPVRELQSKPLGASQFVVFIQSRSHGTSSSGAT